MLSKELNVQVCDATKDDSSTSVGDIKIFFTSLGLNICVFAH
jgi:hypothetical protein